jgi:hypothetical protein
MNAMNASDLYDALYCLLTFKDIARFDVEYNLRWGSFVITDGNIGAIRNHTKWYPFKESNISDELEIEFGVGFMNLVDAINFAQENYT